jgi:hypothetical protein
MSGNPTFVLRNGQLIITPEVNLLVGDPTCCCDSDAPCRVPTEWKLESGQNIYAEGLIAVVNDVPTLMDVPDPWVPIFYYATNIEMELKVKDCGNDWETIETFSVAVELCNENRYPSHTFSGSWEPPSECKCKNPQAVEAGVEECDPCPYLGISSGDGGLNSGMAAKFVGTVDGEWTNLANWEDANGASPASALPTGDVTIAADVTSIPPNFSTAVGILTVQAGVHINVPLSAAELRCHGTIDRNSICEGIFGQITVNGPAEVYNGGKNKGEIIAALVKFSGDAKNEIEGVVTGNARFDDTAENHGNITGNASFYGNSQNKSTGVVGGNGSFYNSADNSGEVVGNGLFSGTGDGGNDPPQNFGLVKGNGSFKLSGSNIGTVEGDGTFEDNADNSSPGKVEGDATFDNLAVNCGMVEGTATFGGNTTNGGPFGPGTCQNAIFNGNSTNGTLTNGAPGGDGGVSPEIGQVIGNATFNGDSENTTMGSVGGNASFTADSINRGGVTGTATFAGCAYNDGGVAGTFIPDPPPDAPTC